MRKDFEKKPNEKSAKSAETLQVARDSAMDRPAPAVDREAYSRAGGSWLAQVMRKLQQSYGNRCVQRLIGRMRSSESDQSQALHPVARGEMEAAFGEDFGDVRIHAGQEAEAEAERQGAQAMPQRSRD